MIKEDSIIRFNWQDHEPPKDSDLLSRYPASIGDMLPWRRLVARLMERSSDASLSVDPAGTGEPLEFRYLEEFDIFLKAIPSAIVRPSKPCVFISHQRADTNNALRIACLADHVGLDCWLDVHDPTLALVNQLPGNDPRRSLLIAAIIEIALLSSTHIIALHTKHSRRSKWVPYELGRAKARKIKSVQAAGWFQRRQGVSTCGDYVKLTVMIDDERGIINWLQKAAKKRSKQTPIPILMNCPTHQTSILK